MDVLHEPGVEEPPQGTAPVEQQLLDVPTRENRRVAPIAEPPDDTQVTLDFRAAVRIESYAGVWRNVSFDADYLRCLAAGLELRDVGVDGTVNENGNRPPLSPG